MNKEKNKVEAQSKVRMYMAWWWICQRKATNLALREKYDWPMTQSVQMFWGCGQFWCVKEIKSQIKWKRHTFLLTEHSR